MGLKNAKLLILALGLWSTGQSTIFAQEITPLAMNTPINSLAFRTPAGHLKYSINFEKSFGEYEVEKSVRSAVSRSKYATDSFRNTHEFDFAFTSRFTMLMGLSYVLNHKLEHKSYTVSGSSSTPDPELNSKGLQDVMLGLDMGLVRMDAGTLELAVQFFLPMGSAEIPTAYTPSGSSSKLASDDGNARSGGKSYKATLEFNRQFDATKEFRLHTFVHYRDDREVYFLKGGTTRDGLRIDRLYKYEGKTDFGFGLDMQFNITPKFSLQGSLGLAIMGKTTYSSTDGESNILYTDNFTDDNYNVLRAGVLAKFASGQGFAFRGGINYLSPEKLRTGISYTPAYSTSTTGEQKTEFDPEMQLLAGMDIFF